MVTIARTGSATTRRSGGLARQEAMYGYLFLAPWILGFIIFVAGPMIAAVVLSFTRFSLGVTALEFIGVENFLRMVGQCPPGSKTCVTDVLFFPSLLRTATWAFMYVPAAIVGAMMTAVLLNQGLTGTPVYRTIFFLPHLTPIVASIFIWAWLLHPAYGFVNEVIWQVTYTLTGQGVVGPKWFGGTDSAIPSLVLVALWGAIGGNMMLIFLAGLQGVPKELYEAAEIDGAGLVSRFRNVTVPMISPTILFNLVLGIIAALQAFSNAFIATDGGPAYATWFFALHIYQNAFTFSEFGYASALAIVFFVIILILTAINFQLSKRWVHYGGEVN